MSKIKNELFRQLTRDDDDWEIDAYYATHKTTGLKYWIANGLLFFHNKSTTVSISLGIVYSIRLFYFLKKCKNRKLLKMISSE